MKRNQGGFTLVEMMVTIVIGSLVTLAATTVLLLGLRINNRSTKTVVRQNTARVVITMLENLAAEGEITDIETDGNTSWRISNAKDVILASYDAETKTIYSSHSRKDPDDETEVMTATPLLENVTDSAISLDKSGLLSISVTTDDITYESSIYCRTMRAPKDNELEHQAAASNPKVEDQEAISETEKTGRNLFLNVLASQYRMAGGSPNPGLVLDGGKYSTGQYYSEWYVGHYGEDKPGWGPDTPWCACFVSWGLCYEDRTNPESDPKDVNYYIDSGSWNATPPAESKNPKGVAFANVDSFQNYFEVTDHWKLSKARQSDATDPIPGDIIFIDWDKGQGTDNYDPAHVGVVLKVESGYVYTIEGNRDNRVMVCKYALSDPIIMGYGIIDWKS